MSQEENLKEKEKIIIQAARKRFAHFGFSKVTMDEIAGDVDMGKASLYYYFPTKEDLFKSVITEEQSEFVNKIESVLKENISASQKLHMYVEQRLQYFQILLNLGTLNVHTFVETKSIFRKLSEDFEEQELKLIWKIIEEGKKKKEFNKNLSERITNVFIHILQGLRLRIIRLIKEKRLEEEVYEELKEEMIITADIFLNGIKCPHKEIK